MPRSPVLAALVAAALGFAAGLFLVWHIVPQGSRPGAPDAPLAEVFPRPGGGAGPWEETLGSPPRFTDVTQAVGVSFRHSNGMTGKCSYPEIMGGGVALFDANGDGYLDVYFVSGNRLPPAAPDPGITNQLYRNNGDGTFTDITRDAGVPGAGYGQGACAADYDNDGDSDLYVSNYGPNILYSNNGDGTFTDVSRAAGVADGGWGQSSCFFDYDGDGWLDLYVQNYLSMVPELFAGSTVELGARRVLDYASPVGFRGSTSRLYRNQGNGTFADVSRQSGLLREDGKGMGAACVDLDGDGWPDVFAANDSMENFWFRNRGNRTFEEVGAESGLAYDADGTPEASMGVDVGDFDGDGRMDLIVPSLRHQVFPLYRNTGGQFVDVSREAGLARATAHATGFNANFLDYDNDGDLDLFFTTGGVRQNELADPEASFVERYGMPDILLANDGKGRYADVSSRAGEHFARLTVGRGSAAGDIDNDGDIDLVLNNLADRAVVLRNDTTGGRWLQLRLVARRLNRDALGASVWVEAGGRRTRALVHGAVTYLSQNDRRIHVGLGAADRVDRVEIRWPSGLTQELRDLPPNRLYTLEEPAEETR